MAVAKSSAEPEPNPVEMLFHCLFRHVLGTFIRSLQPFRDWLHLCRGEHSYIKWWVGRDSNPQSTNYEFAALTNLATDPNTILQLDEGHFQSSPVLAMHRKCHSL